MDSSTSSVAASSTTPWLPLRVARSCLELDGDEVQLSSRATAAAPLAMPGKELRGVSILGSTAPTHVVARMLLFLKEMELDMAKFYKVEDARPLTPEQEQNGDGWNFGTRVRVGAGTWNTMWSDLGDMT